MSTSLKSGVASPWLPYIWLVLSIAALAAISNVAGEQIVHRLAGLEEAPSAPVLAAFSLVALCSFASFYATRGTPLPSFVVAIALGIAGHTLFAPIVQNAAALSALVTGSAAIILFSGGLEMPLRQFFRLLVKVALLAFPGVLITGFALSWVVQGLGGVLGMALAPGRGDPARRHPRLHRSGRDHPGAAACALQAPRHHGHRRRRERAQRCGRRPPHLRVPQALAGGDDDPRRLPGPRRARDGALPRRADRPRRPLRPRWLGDAVDPVAHQAPPHGALRRRPDLFPRHPHHYLHGGGGLRRQRFPRRLSRRPHLPRRRAHGRGRAFLLPGDRRRREAGDLPARRRTGRSGRAHRLRPARHRRRAGLHVRHPPADGVRDARRLRAVPEQRTRPHREGIALHSPSCARPAPSPPCCWSPPSPI